MRRALGRAAVLFVAAPFALALGGCAAADTSQQVTIAYADAGTPVETVVELPGVRCTAVGEQVLLGSTEPHAGTQGLFTATARPASQSHVIGVSLGEGLWFLSDAPFEFDGDSADFDDVPGTVARGDSITSATTIVDEQAELSASLRCTTGELK